MPYSRSDGPLSQKTVPIFLRLLREIRNIIYTRVLVESNPLLLFQDPANPIELFAPG